MSTSVGPLWPETTKLRLFAAAAVVTAFVAMGEGGFGPVVWSLLPIPAFGFLAKYRWPQISTMVPAIPSLVCPIVVNINDSDAEFAMFLLVLAVMLVTVMEPNRLLADGFTLVSMVLVFLFGVTGVIDWAWSNWLAALLLSWAFSTVGRRYEEVFAELQVTQAKMLDQAALIERRRIARDIHDLIGHSLSVVMLHVAGARRILRRDPDEAERALLQAEDAGRASMAEVRRTVSLLRDDDGSDGSAPTPDLSDIATIVDQYRDAGLAVAYEQSGPTHEVDPAVAVASHRIAQEALSNVSKHTVGAEVEVEVGVDDGICRVSVVNRGGHPVMAQNGSGVGSGHGLTGMRERAVSVGGSLIAGPIADGWSVEATFPRTSPLSPFQS